MPVIEHPSYEVMINEAIFANELKLTSKLAMEEYIKSTHPGLPHIRTYLGNALARLVEKGVLDQIRMSYRLANKSRKSLLVKLEQKDPNKAILLKSKMGILGRPCKYEAKKNGLCPSGRKMYTTKMDRQCCKKKY